MSKKLTLSVDDELIQFAHIYSEQAGLSISKMFEQYLLNLKQTSSGESLNPLIKKLYGSFQSNPIPDKKILRKYFNEKSHN